MADDDRDVVITISAKNLTEDEFKKVKKGLGGVDKEVNKTNTKVGMLSRSFQSFGKAVPGALKAVAVGATAVAGAVTAAGVAIVKLGQRGTEVAGVERAFVSLAEAAGESSDLIISKTGEASRGLVSDMEIMSAANKGLLLGLPITSDSMADLSKTAIVLGKAMKQDAATSLDDLITGLGRASPLILDNLGITVKAGEANRLYAAELGKSVNELTDAEKKTAFYNAALTAAESKVAEMGEGQLTFTERLQQSKVMLANLVDGISAGIATSPVFNAALSSINDILQTAFGGENQSLIELVVGGIERAAFFAIGLGQAGLQAAQVITQGWGGIKVLFFESTLAVGELQLKFVDTIATVLETIAVIPVLGTQYGNVGALARTMADNTALANEKLRGMSEQAQLTALGHDTLGQALNSGREALDQVTQSMIAGVQVEGEYNAATQELTATTDAAAVSTQTWDGTLAGLPDTVSELLRSVVSAREEIQIFDEETGLNITNFQNNMVAAKVGVGDLQGATQAATDRMTAAFHHFGLQTQAELEKTQKTAEESFAAIKESGELSATELAELWKKVEESKREATAETESFTMTSQDAILSGSTQVLGELGAKNKAAAIASALISTYAGVAKALASAPWPASLALAAGALAAGLANVAKIRSSNPGFAEGTGGLDFQNFGSETLAALHGMEAVIPQGSGHMLGKEVAREINRSSRRDGAEMAEVAGLFGELRGLPQAIQRAVRDGMLLTSG